MNSRTGPGGYGGDRIASSYGANYPHTPYRPGLARNTTGVWVQSLPELNYPAEQMYAADNDDQNYNYAPGDNPFLYCACCFGNYSLSRLGRRHNEGANVVFFDGHSKWLAFGRFAEIYKLECQRLWLHAN